MKLFFNLTLIQSTGSTSNTNVEKTTMRPVTQRPTTTKLTTTTTTTTTTTIKNPVNENGNIRNKNRYISDITQLTVTKTTQLIS